MKRFVDEITVSDEELMLDIVQALESCPISGKKYEVEMFNRAASTDDPLARIQRDRFLLKIFAKEMA